MSKALTQWPRVRFMDSNGDPLAGGIIHTYLSGTSTPKATYSDSGGTLNANPVILDSEGYADIWLDGDYQYRFRLENAAGTLQWQRDNIGASAGSQVSTLADLRNTTGTTEGEVIRLLGYVSNGDGGGGEFFWSASSTATDNTGTVVKATATATGRWLRLFSGPVNVKWFGARGDNSADDTNAFQRAIDYVDSLGGGQIDVPFEGGETYKANIVIANRRGVHLHGTGWTKQSFGPPATALTRCISPYNVSLPTITVGDDAGTGHDTLTSGTLISNLTLSGLGASRGEIGLKLIGGAYRCVYDNISILGFTAKGLWSVAATDKRVFYQFFTGLTIICGDDGSTGLYLDGSGAFTGYPRSTNITSHYFDKVSIATFSGATSRGVVVKGAQCTFADTYIQMTSAGTEIGLELATDGVYADPSVSCNNLVIDTAYEGGAMATLYMNVAGFTAAGDKPLSQYIRGDFSIDGLIKLQDGTTNDVMGGSYGAYAWRRKEILSDPKFINTAYITNLKYPEYLGNYFAAGGGPTPIVRLYAPNGFELTTGNFNVQAGSISVMGTKVVGSRITGWTVPTGTNYRAAWDTGTVTLAGLAQIVKSLQDDLTAHGLIGA